MTEYTVRITTRRDLPEDVVVEHIAYGLRGIVDPERKRASHGVTVKLLDVKRPRSHPFEGPVVFDDDEPTKTGKTEHDAKPEFANGGYVNGTRPLVGGLGPSVYVFNEKGLVSQAMTAIREDFPHLSDLFRAKGAPQPPAEGDWQLNDEDKVGEDL